MLAMARRSWSTAPMTRTLVVNAAGVLPTDGWAVRPQGAEPLSVHRRKTDAVAQATLELSQTPSGGDLEVYLRVGRLEYRRHVPPINAPLPPGLRQQRIAETQQMLKQADKGVEFALEAWTALALFLGPAAAALIGAGVAEQRSVLGVFFATLAWSGGVAGSWFLLTGHGPNQLSGLPALGAASMCFVASAGFAVWIGVGSYSGPLPTTRFQGTGQFALLLSSLNAAITTFGLGGVLLGTAVGAVVGARARKLADAPS